MALSRLYYGVKIVIRVKPRSSKRSVEKIDDSNYIVSVMSSPMEGKANKEVIEVLANYFKIAKSKISIIKGETAKIKMVEIDN